MKKILLSLIVCILMSSLVLAQGQQGIHEPGTGIDNREIKEAGQGSGQGQDNETQGDGQGTQTNTETQQQNQGEETQIKNQIKTKNKIKSGIYTTENGKKIQVQEQSNNRVQLKSGEVSAQTSMEMTQEQTQDRTKLQVKLSNGKNSEVKVMPDIASEKAMERLKKHLRTMPREMEKMNYVKKELIKFGYSPQFYQVAGHRPKKWKD